MLLYIDASVLKVIKERKEAFVMTFPFKKFWRLSMGMPIEERTKWCGEKIIVLEFSNQHYFFTLPC